MRELGIKYREHILEEVGNKKLSKRDPQSNLFLHRDRGFIPEGLLNYLALLGWGIADDHDVFSLAEMVAAFDVADVNSNPARFDERKAEAINAEHIRMLEPAEFAARLGDYLVARDRFAQSPAGRSDSLGFVPLLLEFVFVDLHQMGVQILAHAAFDGFLSPDRPNGFFDVDH